MEVWYEARTLTLLQSHFVELILLCGESKRTEEIGEFGLRSVNDSNHQDHPIICTSYHHDYLPYYQPESFHFFSFLAEIFHIQPALIHGPAKLETLLDLLSPQQLLCTFR